METPIYRAAYRWTSEEVATSWRRHRTTSLSADYVRLVSGFSLLLTALICFVVFYILPRQDPRDDRGDGSLWPLFIVPAFTFYWVCLRNASLDWQARWGFKKQAGADELLEWELSLKEIKFWQRGVSYCALAWKVFTKVVEVQDGFLLFAHPRFFFWLPFRAFEMPEAPERVREIIQASGVAYQKTDA